MRREDPERNDRGNDETESKQDENDDEVSPEVHAASVASRNPTLRTVSIYRGLRARSPNFLRSPLTCTSSVFPLSATDMFQIARTTSSRRTSAPGRIMSIR